MKRDEERKRNSKVGKINGEGKLLVHFIEERGWIIFNGNVRGNGEGEYTFSRRKVRTVIDYILRNREVRDKLMKM